MEITDKEYMKNKEQTLSEKLKELHRLRNAVDEAKVAVDSANEKMRNFAEELIKEYGEEKLEADGSGGIYVEDSTYRMGYTYIKPTRTFCHERALKLLPRDVLLQCSEMKRVINEAQLAVLVEKGTVTKKQFMSFFDEKPNSRRFYFGTSKKA